MFVFDLVQIDGTCNLQSCDAKQAAGKNVKHTETMAGAPNLNRFLDGDSAQRVTCSDLDASLNICILVPGAIL